MNTWNIFTKKCRDQDNAELMSSGYCCAYITDFKETFADSVSARREFQYQTAAFRKAIIHSRRQLDI
jgi:hypothetical protein